MIRNSDLFQHESDFPELDRDRAAEHLRQALRFRTVSHLDTARTDYSQFDALHAFLRESYPLTAGQAEWTEIGHSLLIILRGSDPALRPRTGARRTPGSTRTSAGA